MLTRDQILHARPVLQKVPVPEWSPDGSDDQAYVWIRRFTVAERNGFNEEYIGNEHAAEKLFANFVCDEKGKSIFSLDDVNKLSELDADVVTRVAHKILEHSKLVQESVELAEKNSEPTPSDSSSSD